MKKLISISASLAFIIVTLNSCSTSKGTSDDYFGYNPKPKEVAVVQTTQGLNGQTTDENYYDEATGQPTTTVVNNYYSNPYGGYYNPTWDMFYPTFGYGWDYYPYYYSYGYPYYWNYYYPYSHHYGYNHFGYGSNYYWWGHKDYNEKEKERKDRNFGVTRGTYDNNLKNPNGNWKPNRGNGTTTIVPGADNNKRVIDNVNRTGNNNTKTGIGVVPVGGQGNRSSNKNPNVNIEKGSINSGNTTNRVYDVNSRPGNSGTQSNEGNVNRTPVRRELPATRTNSGGDNTIKINREAARPAPSGNTSSGSSNRSGSSSGSSGAGSKSSGSSSGSGSTKSSGGSGPNRR